MTTETSTATTTNSGTESGNGRQKNAAADAYESARQRTSAAYSAARERAGSAYESARDTARSAGRRASDGIEANPMGAVLGGLALGAVAGLLLPRTRQEEEWLGPVGRRITDKAREAANAARETGKQQLSDAAEQAVGALRSSASAAAGAVRDGNQG